MNMKKIRWFWQLLKNSYRDLNRNDPLRLSSSTAFFATFSIIPIIILFLNLFSTIFSKQLLTGEVFNALEVLIGEEAAGHLSLILRNVQEIQQGTFVTLGMILFLMFIATTLFIVVQNSFNQIWKVKPKENVSFRFILKNRGMSLLVIFVTGILFLAALLVDVIMGFLGENVFILLPGVDQWLIRLLNTALSLAVFTLWFATIYKLLPDVLLRWKVVWFGSFLTAVLFLAGQYILGQVLVTGNLNTIYGASASLVLLLLFIFYCSFILYYGACLVKNHAELKSEKLDTTKYAVHYEIREAE